jgi:hypothetical protein
VKTTSAPDAGSHSVWVGVDAKLYFGKLRRQLKARPAPRQSTTTSRARSTFHSIAAST